MFFSTMHARQAATTRQARLEACSLAHVREGVQGVVKKIFSVATKTSLEVLSQPKWTPEAGLKPEKCILLRQKICFSTTMRARQAAAPRQAQLQACSLAHMQEGVQEVVNKKRVML